MKQLSWEKFNEQPDPEENEGQPELQGILMNSMGSIGHTINNYDDFNMFIAHTNFYITANIVATLCMVEGLEAVDILTPYRFRIAIGKLFASEPILAYIQKELTKD